MVCLRSCSKWVSNKLSLFPIHPIHFETWRQKELGLFFFYAKMKADITFMMIRPPSTPVLSHPSSHLSISDSQFVPCVCVCVSVRNNNRFRKEDCLREKSRASFLPVQFPCRPVEDCMFKKTACHLNTINKSALNLPTLKIPHNAVGCSEKYTTYCKSADLQGTPPTCSHLSNKSKTQIYLQ